MVMNFMNCSKFLMIKKISIRNKIYEYMVEKEFEQVKSVEIELFKFIPALTLKQKRVHKRAESRDLLTERKGTLYHFYIIMEPKFHQIHARTVKIHLNLYTKYQIHIL